jgi:hypothetical protein
MDKYKRKAWLRDELKTKSRNRIRTSRIVITKKTMQVVDTWDRGPSTFKALKGNIRLP